MEFYSGFETQPKSKRAKKVATKTTEVPSQETLEEAGVAYAKTVNQNHTSHMLGFVNGAKWQQERMYSYDELRQIAYKAYCIGQLDEPTEGKFNQWINQFNKEQQK